MQAKDAINREATHSRQSMRAFLSALREAGELVSISQPVRLEYEVAGCLAEIDSGPALHFTNVAGTSGAGTMPIVGNLLNSLPRFALGLGSTIDEMQASLLAAIDKPSAASRGVVGTLPGRDRRGSIAGRRTADTALLRKGRRPLHYGRCHRRQGPAHRRHQPVDCAADAAWRKPRLRRHRAQSPSRGAGAGGSCARRKTGHCGLHRKPSRGSGGGMSLSRAGRG